MQFSLEGLECETSSILGKGKEVFQYNSLGEAGGPHQGVFWRVGGGSGEQTGEGGGASSAR